MIHQKPAAAIGMECWGLKYQDGDRECAQCRFKDSCRPAMLDRIMNPQAQRTPLPVFRNYAPHSAPPPPPPPQPQPSNYKSAMVPMPTRPFVPPPTNSAPVSRSSTVPFPSSSAAASTSPQVIHQQPPPQQYYQQGTGYSLPSTSNPNPLAPMFRPGAPSPAYYFTQYPGESVASRVGKNMLLRAAEAIFGELMQFFRHWTWPPN